MQRQISARGLARLLGAWQAGGPAYRALAGGLRLLVLDGRLPLGTRLPGERALAAALGVSRTTVTAAYAALRDDGFLDSLRGSGSTTTVPAATRGDEGPTPGLAPSSDRPDVLDLAVAAPPAVSTVHAAYAWALSALPRHLPGSGYDLLGLPGLRAAVADRFTARGVPTRPEHVLVTSGAQHALALLLAELVRPGDRVVVEHPTYPNALSALARAGARPVPVPVTSRSWDLDAFVEALRTSSPRLAYLVPDFHNPTGHCLDEMQRADVGRLAQRAGTVVVVDETLSDLWLDAPPPAPAAAAGPSVITLGGLGKSHWAGLRVGWVRAPVSVVRRLAAGRVALDLGSPVVEQLAAEFLLRAGDDPLAERRDLLRAGRDALTAAVARQLPGWTYVRPAGGLALWARLDRPVSTALAAAAERHGVRLAAGPLFGVDGSFEQFLRLPFTLPPEQLDEAVRRISLAGAALSGAVGRGAGPDPVERTLTVA